MWLAVLTITLTLLTFAHAERGRPTLKDDERFRTGPFRVSLRELHLEVILRELDLENLRELAMKSMKSMNLLNMNMTKTAINTYPTLSKVSLSRYCCLNAMLMLSLCSEVEQEAPCGKCARSNKLSYINNNLCVRSSEVTLSLYLVLRNVICIILCAWCIILCYIWLGNKLLAVIILRLFRRYLPSCYYYFPLGSRNLRNLQHLAVKSFWYPDPSEFP